MINDDTYKDMLKELHKDKENPSDILLEKKFLREKEEEVEEAEVVDEQGTFKRSMPQQPRSGDANERRREQLTRNVNAITRERISQANQQKWLDHINQKNK